jgi:homospermidine synthase
MTTRSNRATWNGPIVMIGFGSIGRGTLPLILRHIRCDRSKITIIDPSEESKHIADAEGITFVKQALTKSNFKSILKPLLSSDDHRAFIVNLSVDVDSMDIMRLARAARALYVDTVIEPWPGFYYNKKVDNASRTNYALREKLVALKTKLGKGPTAVSCCGANPGMVSWFVKQALLNLASDTKVKIDVPKTRDGWAKLMRTLGVKGVHIAERDTQRAIDAKRLGTFVNTWSVDGLISEGKQPAELGWGTHEKKMPPDGHKHKSGSRAAIYLERAGANTRVRTWVPEIGPQYGLLVTHNEAISIADYYTVRNRAKKAIYRPTCNYAYHPCNDAILSLHEMFGNGGKKQPRQHILEPQEIADGQDKLGVLLYGHKKNAYWFGSQLSINEARKLAPYQSATGMQVTSAVLTGIIWAIENPNSGIVETDEMDFRRCLELQLPYLGPVGGVYTDWNPLKSIDGLFVEPIDKKDPWQFTNILVR